MDMESEQQISMKFTRKYGGQTKEYIFMKSVKSMEELDEFRFKNHCRFTSAKPSHILKPINFPCTRKFGSQCTFELRALRPNLKDDTIHVYAHSEHNHPLTSEVERRKHILSTDLMPDANPPTNFRTPDNIEWTFNRTLTDYEQVEKFRSKNECKSTTKSKTWLRIRYVCRLKHKNCEFKLLAMKTCNQRYHVYQHGEHDKHPPVVKPKKNQQPIRVQLQKKRKQIDNEEEDDEGEGDEKDEDEDSEEDEEEEESKKDDEDGEDEDDTEESQQQKPPKKITKYVKGEKRNYYYRTTVKTMEELTDFRYKNHCRFVDNKRMRTFKKKPKSMVCSTRNTSTKGCDFRLMAFRPDLAHEDIHVYAFSQHNHPLVSEEKRVHGQWKTTELMPYANPPMIFVTPDNVEWTFLQTIPDDDKMEEFRFNNNCKIIHRNKKHLQKRFRYVCHHKFYKMNCQFMLMAMKNTKQGFHVYQHDEHNHPLNKKKHQQPPRVQLQQKRKRMDEEEEEDEGEEGEEGEDDVDEEEEEGEEDEHEDSKEDEEEDSKEDEEDEDDVDEEEGPQQKPPKKITKNVNGGKRNYYYQTTVKSIEELEEFRFKNHCRDFDQRGMDTFTSRSMVCLNGKAGKGCDFELMALRPDLAIGGIHVYAFSQHNHPLVSEEKRVLHHWRTKSLMPYANPPMIFVTPDNIEWTFLQTIPDDDKMEKLRFKNNCKFIQLCSQKRFRYVCNRNFYKVNCQFKLLAMKNAKLGYHVYQHDEHNHPLIKKKEQPNSVQLRQKRKRMDEEEDEEEENEEEGEEEVESEEHDEEKGEEEQEKQKAVTMEVDEDTSVEPIERDEDRGEDEENESEEEVEDDKKDDEEEKKPIKEEQEEIVPIKQEVKEEGEEGEELIEDEDEGTEQEQNPFANPSTETLEVKLEETNEKVYKWMAGIGPNKIEETIGEWDKLSLLKMVEMADQEIRQHPQKLNLWLPWLKCAIPKCLPQIEGFNIRFKDLIQLALAFI